MVLSAGGRLVHLMCIKANLFVIILRVYTNNRRSNGNIVLIRLQSPSAHRKALAAQPATEASGQDECEGGAQEAEQYPGARKGNTCSDLQLCQIQKSVTSQNTFIQFVNI